LEDEFLPLITPSCTLTVKTALHLLSASIICFIICSDSGFCQLGLDQLVQEAGPDLLGVVPQIWPAFAAVFECPFHDPHQIEQAPVHQRGCINELPLEDARTVSAKNQSAIILPPGHAALMQAFSGDIRAGFRWS
jgi:hypothetical protein